MQGAVCAGPSRPLDAVFVSELFGERGEDDIEEREGRSGWVCYRLREDLRMQLDPIDKAA